MKAFILRVPWECSNLAPGPKSISKRREKNVDLSNRRGGLGLALHKCDNDSTVTPLHTATKLNYSRIKSLLLKSPIIIFPPMIFQISRLFSILEMELSNFSVKVQRF